MTGAAQLLSRWMRIDSSVLYIEHFEQSREPLRFFCVRSSFDYAFAFCAPRSLTYPPE